MCNNGKTIVEYLTPVTGGTAANATYLLALDHFTCGNKKLCVTDAYLVSADVKFTPIVPLLRKYSVVFRQLQKHLTGTRQLVTLNYKVYTFIFSHTHYTFISSNLH